MLQSVSSQYETTYRKGGTQHLVHLRSEKRNVPWNEVDRIADRKFDGGFNTSKNNLCPECHTYKSKNGSCFC